MDCVKEFKSEKVGVFKDFNIYFTSTVQDLGTQFFPKQ